jgi:hypothetical protein
VFASPAGVGQGQGVSITDTAIQFLTSTAKLAVLFKERAKMSENIAQTVQKAVQDIVAPDVRELKVLVTALQKQIDQRFDAQNDKSETQFRALMAALGEFKAQSELTSLRVISALSERVAVLEAQRQ